MSTLMLTMADGDKVIEAGAADEIVVRLPENPTTGYRWQIDRIDGVVEPSGDSYQADPTMQFGSGGIREFRFRRTAPGTARLSLKHWQAWEGDRSVDERFSISLSFAR
jgi:inhibitor of cysteine peptidase